MKPLVLSQDFRRQIERQGVAEYPNECCGIIYGLDRGEQRMVEALEPVPNDFEAGEQFHRFSISPEQLMQAERHAGGSGLLVLGFYHSHPDHPAHPSEYDRRHAWPFYSYLIVSIVKQSPAALTSWILDEQDGQFHEQPVVDPFVL